jgi:Sulfotransferase family
VSETTVVYIAGCGRSGSTVLDLTLGQGEGWFSMGEFRLFWYAIRDHWRCGCGRDVTECPFWAKACAQLSAGASDVLPALRSTVRLRRAAGLMQPALLGSHRADLDALGQALRIVYHGAAETAGASVLVDSSKDSLYGLVLADVLDVRLHVIHLVRDSRAVAWSWQRKRKRPEIAHEDAYMPQRTAFRAAVDWDLRNALVHLLRRRADGYTRVTYEEFTSAPAATIDRIRSRVGAPASDAVPASEIPGGKHHTVAGNPVRFARDALQLRPDLEWQQALPADDRRTVTAVTLPLLAAYGYLSRRGRSD